MHITKKDSCRADLKARILRLELAPGVELDETQIAEQYGLSRTPLREIFQGLSGEGYIRLEQNRGARVASMDLGVMRTFFQTAPLVYATMARLAAENRRTSDLAALKDTQLAFDRATQARDASEAALLNHRFHQLIGDMAANPYLMPSLDRMLIDHTRLSQTFYRPGNETEQKLVRKASDQHDAMIIAIERQEPSVAVELTLQHWDLSRDRMERYVRPDPLPVDVISLRDKTNAV